MKEGGGVGRGWRESEEEGMKRLAKLRERDAKVELLSYREEGTHFFPFLFSFSSLSSFVSMCEKKERKERLL